MFLVFHKYYFKYIITEDVNFCFLFFNYLRILDRR